MPAAGKAGETSGKYVLGSSTRRRYNPKIWYEPTDTFRARKPFLNGSSPKPDFISPNYQEFLNIHQILFPAGGKTKFPNPIQECIAKASKMAELIDNIIITLGKEGVLVVRKGEAEDSFFAASKKSRYIRREGRISHRLYRPELIAEKDIVNVSGAGDCFASGFISAMLRGETEKKCVEFGFKCSAASLKSSKTVPSNFFSKD